MGKDQSGRPVFVIGPGYFLRAHQFRGQRQHQGRFGGVGVPVFRVGEKFGSDARADFRHVADAGERIVPAAADDFDRAAEWGGVADVAVNQQDPLETGTVKPVEDFDDHVDEGLG
jgi:hypothetical protein